jgi:hypothetical protein
LDVGKISLKRWQSTTSGTVSRGGAAMWLRRLAVEHAEEEEDDFFFPLPKGYLGMGWLS